MTFVIFPVSQHFFISAASLFAERDADGQRAEGRFSSGPRAPGNEGSEEMVRLESGVGRLVGWDSWSDTHGHMV